MVRCALDMGLRCGEVAKLQLADIDWRNGTVTLRRTKSRREDISWPSGAAWASKRATPGMRY